MQVAYHLGVHGSDQDGLVRTLLQNRNILSKLGTEVPSPGRYRGVLGEALNALRGGKASEDMQELVLDAILDTEKPKRIVLSQPGFLGLPEKAISARGLFADVAARISALSNLFPDAEVEYFLALKNPATLIPFLVEAIEGKQYDSILGDIDPMQLRWNEAAQRLVQAAQGRRVVIWCNEDAPILWPELVRRIGGIQDDVRVLGSFSMASKLMRPEGTAWLRNQLLQKSTITMEERRELFTRALAQFHLPETIYQVVNYPDWTQPFIDEITELYYSDVAEIAALPGVEFMMP